MSAGSILSLGFGSFSDVNHLVTLGYTPGVGLAPIVVPDVITVPAPPRAPVDFVFSSGYMAGVRVPKFRSPDRPVQRIAKQPEDTDLKEMMALYAMWRDS